MPAARNRPAPTRSNARQITARRPKRSPSPLTTAILPLLQAALDKQGGDLKPFIQTHLSPRHRDAPGTGSPMPTLAIDADRDAGPVAGAMTQGIRGYLHTLATHRPDGSVTDAPTEADKARAISSLSALVGGMVQARATAEAAPELSDEILTVLQATLAVRAQQ